MDHIGIDVHKRESQICILAEGEGELIEQRIRTAPGALRGRAPQATPGVEGDGSGNPEL
jgi:hypothetical protein